jgi:uncharacterized protein
VTTIFLTAQWRYLTILNFEVDPDILKAWIPTGTVLDEWDGRTFMSLVGFRFLDTRIRGWAIPFHRDFDEINLRFYVRRLGPTGWRRGVVFIKEVVPRRAIAAVARWVYNENYVRCRTRSAISPPEDTDAGTFTYEWQDQRSRCRIETRVRGAATPLEPGTESQFIADHYWGYVRHRDGTTVEYHVEHPAWRFWEVENARFVGQGVDRLYGPPLSEVLSRQPWSALVADGSPVVVHRGVPLLTGSRVS